MKKIVAVLLVLALVSGVAFADPKISLNYRSKAAIASFNKGNVTLLDTANATYKGISDSTKLAIADENYGAEFAMNLNGGGFDKLNTYNGWLAFGNLKLGTGVWKDGLLDGNYRVKKDADAGSYEGIDFEANKLGTIFKNTQITFVDDMANFAGGSATQYASYAEYKAKLNDDLQLNAFVAGISGAWDSETKDGKTTAIKMGLTSRVQFNVKGLLNSEVIYKTPVKGTNALALYVQPKLVKGLDATVGGAVALIEGTEGISNWGVDVRARYQVNKALSITEYFNISGNKASSDLNKPLATNKTWSKAEMAAWNMIGARYIIDDAVTAYTNVGLLADLTKDNTNGIQWRVTPGAQIYAAKNAFINVGVAISGQAKEKDSVAVDVPVIFRVKL